jgi:exopolysaccharide biosynthesis polyprenyl glycosylphosphotransferase
VSVVVDSPAEAAVENGAWLPLPGDLPRRRHASWSRGRVARRALIAADVSGFACAFVLAAAVAKGTGWFGRPEAARALAALLVSLPLWVLLAQVVGLYGRDGRRAHYSTTQEIAPVAAIVSVAVLVYLLGGETVGFGPADRLHATVFWAASVLFVLCARTLARAIVREHADFVQNTVIVGAGEVGQAVAWKFLHHPETGINVVGFADDGFSQLRAELTHLPVLCPPRELASLMPQLDVDRVVIAFTPDGHEETLALVRDLRERHVLIDIVPRLFDLVGPGAEMHDVDGMPLVSLSTVRLSRSSVRLKRGLDLVVGGSAALLLAPLFGLVALAIKLDSRGPVFFRQKRVGGGGVEFDLLKFRTMVEDAESRKHEVAHLNMHLRPGRDPRMFKVPNDPRVTRVGRVLRRYFLDETPQLLNVLRGEMSLIGPRPLIPEEACFVDDWGRRRLELKPGMTGPWQVHGRSSIAFGEMVKLDYFYVTTWTLGSDLRLLLQTIPLVFRGETPV